MQIVLSESETFRGHPMGLGMWTPAEKILWETAKTQPSEHVSIPRFPIARGARSFSPQPLVELEWRPVEGIAEPALA